MPGKLYCTVLQRNRALSPYVGLSNESLSALTFGAAPLQAVGLVEGFLKAVGSEQVVASAEAQVLQGQPATASAAVFNADAAAFQVQVRVQVTNSPSMPLVSHTWQQ